MMKTEKELRELEIWIAENVFGAEITHTPSLATDAYMQTESDKRLMMSAHRVPDYTTNPDAAFSVLEKCHDRRDIIFTQKRQDYWVVGVYGSKCPGPLVEVFGEAETLPLAIALFARKLFGTPPSDFH